MEEPKALTSVSAKEEKRTNGSRDLLSQTRAEQEEALKRLRFFERKAARYDWLRKNGMHTHAISFLENSFEPQLLEFMGLNETESDQLRTMASTANEAVLEWELANAQCIEDTPTNCVYELPPLPEEYKANFIQELATLFDPDDMETMNPIVEKLYESLNNKRIASVTYVSKEEYLQQRNPLFQSNSSISTDMLELMIQRFDENGNQRGRYSTTFGIDQDVSGFNMQGRWAHLFNYGGEIE